MIDSHVHSKYSKHAFGDIENIVLLAIERGIKVITITDHAPFPIDKNNRLLDYELKDYFEDINYVKVKYSAYIKILKGLEIDYLPDYENYIHDLISNMEIDFLIGSIHYVYINNQERINVWDIEKINNEKFIIMYFSYLKNLIQFNIFDSIGHPDSILRGGVSSNIFIDNFVDLIPLIQKSNISYEINSSGMRKTTYDLNALKDVKGIWNFPLISLIKILNENNVNFTIGSDSHSPEEIGLGINIILNILKDIKVKELSYYQQRNLFKIDINDLIFKD
jgi:histidinol-phosphatase (PHP family)